MIHQDSADVSILETYANYIKLRFLITQIESVYKYIYKHIDTIHKGFAKCWPVVPSSTSIHEKIDCRCDCAATLQVKIIWRHD